MSRNGWGETLHSEGLDEIKARCKGTVEVVGRLAVVPALPAHQKRKEEKKEKKKKNTLLLDGPGGIGAGRAHPGAALRRRGLPAACACACARPLKRVQRRLHLPDQHLTLRTHRRAPAHNRHVGRSRGIAAAAGLFAVPGPVDRLDAGLGGPMLAVGVPAAAGTRL